MMSLELTISLFSRLLALSFVIQTVEALNLNRNTDVIDLWTWEVQRADIQHAPGMIQKKFELLFHNRNYTLFLICQLAASLSLLLFTSFFIAIVLFLSCIVSLIRWRGAFNGGSDFMTLVTVTGLVIGTGASLIIDHETAWRASFWYVTIHSISSYFISGAVKLIDRHWRNGNALIYFLNGGLHGPLPTRSLLQNKMFARVASWSVIGWEISFPIVLLDDTIAELFFAIAAIFHLLVFRFFGLNRFFWAWIATFPAILYCAGRI